MPNRTTRAPLYRLLLSALFASLPPCREWKLSQMETELLTVPLIEGVSGRHLTGEIDGHRITFPVLDQRLLAKISVHELLDEFVAAELKELHVRFHPAIQRHGDAPRLGKDLGVLDRHFVPDDVGRPQREALDQVHRLAVKI